MTTIVAGPSEKRERYQPGAVALRDAWFAVVHQGDLRDGSIRRAIHGDPIIIRRDRGRVRALHGAHSHDEYPVAERYGYVWVWYGEPDNASADLIPRIPLVPAGGASPRARANVTWDCTYELLCENVLDLTHGDYLHSALLGNALSDDDEIFVESTSETVTMTRIARGRCVPAMQRPFVGGARTQDMAVVTLTHVRTGLFVSRIMYRPGIEAYIVGPPVPESNTLTRMPATLGATVPKWAESLFFRYLRIVFREDNWALRAQNSQYIRGEFDRKHDVSSSFDRAGLQYRRAHMALAARQAAGDYTYRDDGDPQRDVSSAFDLDSRLSS